MMFVAMLTGIALHDDMGTRSKLTIIMWSAVADPPSSKLRSMIIDGAGEADGYYMYSPDDQFCLKYEVGEA